MFNDVSIYSFLIVLLLVYCEFPSTSAPEISFGTSKGLSDKLLQELKDELTQLCHSLQGQVR